MAAKQVPPPHVVNSHLTQPAFSYRHISLFFFSLKNQFFVVSLLFLADLKRLL